MDFYKAIRAIQRALLQLEAGEKFGFDCLDNADTISALRACLIDAGHIGYAPALSASDLRAAVTLGLSAQGLEG